jgi:hypothetical protein
LIEDRPKIVDLKQRFETNDTIIGKNHKAIVSINDRATGILRMKIKAKSELVRQAAIELLENWKPITYGMVDVRPEWDVDGQIDLF